MTAAHAHDLGLENEFVSAMTAALQKNLAETKNAFD